MFFVVRRELFFGSYITPTRTGRTVFFLRKFLRPRHLTPFHLSFPVRKRNTSTLTRARSRKKRDFLSTKQYSYTFPHVRLKKSARKLSVRIYTHTHTHTRNYEKNALLFLSSSCRVGECCQRFVFFLFFFCDDVSTTTTTKFASTWGRKINLDFDFPKLRVLVRGHRWRHALGNNPNR